MKHPTRLLCAILGLLLVALVSSCGADATGGSPELAGTGWQLVEYGDPENPRQPNESYRPTLTFEEDRVFGSTGCNSVSGEYSLDGTTISFGALAQTERACAEAGVMEQEAEYTRLLAMARSVSRSGNTLTLTAPDGILRFAQVEPA
jgi:heat shock protein HslJ